MEDISRSQKLIFVSQKIFSVLLFLNLYNDFHIFYIFSEINFFMLALWFFSFLQQLYQKKPYFLNRIQKI